ncbi:Jag N-terminal domain-containing protein [bacterium]|nr:Jag N-terminal domain-containing protein [bacterium]
MKSVEVAGKTLEEARATAARELGVSEDQLTVEVLDEPRGILGRLGTHEYRIRASVADTEATTSEPSCGDEPVCSDDSTPEADDELQPSADAAAVGVETLNHVLSLMGIDAEAIVTHQNSDEVGLEIRGADVGHTIGHHGAALDALQLVLAIIVNRGTDHAVRIVLDAEGYRERRKQMLEKMAHTHAAKAKEAGKEIVVTDLKPYERRIVHLALKDDPDVETYSEGEGDDRHLVISPRV